MASRPSIQRGLFAGALVAAAGLLAGCAAPAPEPTATDPVEYERATVRLALHFNSPQASWVGIYVAEEEGYYDELGIDLDIQYLGGSTLAVQAVGSGQADIGLAAPDSLLAAFEQEIPLVAVANHIQQDSTGVIVNGEAESFEDLAGLRVATAQGTAESGMFQAALATADVADDVTIDYVESAAKCTMVISGNADACTGFAYSQFVQLQLAGLEPSFLPFSTDEAPLPGHMIFATEKFVADSGDVVARFLEATFRGYAAADADRANAFEVISALATTADPAQLERATDLVLDLTHSDRTEEFGWGYITEEVWQNLIDALTAGGVIDADLDPSEFFTNDLLPAGAADWR